MLQRHPELIYMATPKLQGLAKAMAMLEHDMEDGAGKLLAKVESVGARGMAALETQLIARFKRHHDGPRPFANRVK